jgi:hypothetical protein
MMEKTWEIREKEIRESIAERIEHEIEMAMPPVDDTEFAIYNAMHWVLEVVRGNK